MAALVALIRPCGVIDTTATIAQEDSARDVRALSLFVRSECRSARRARRQGRRR